MIYEKTISLSLATKPTIRKMRFIMRKNSLARVLMPRAQVVNMVATIME